MISTKNPNSKIATDIKIIDFGLSKNFDPDDNN